MKKYKAYTDENFCLFPVCEADSFLTRLKGLMFKKGLNEKEGLLLKHCSSIHCFFMRFNIDAVYLNGDFTVVGKETVRPWHIGKMFSGAKHVLEVSEGIAEMFEPGIKLNFTEMSEDNE